MADKWEIVGNSRVIAIHAALLPSGKVLYFGGDQHDDAPPNPPGLNATCLFDPITRTVQQIESPRDNGNVMLDVFCCGHCQLETGDILVAGGTDKFPPDAPPLHGDLHHFTGIPNATVFDWAKETWFFTGSMSNSRWYPTLITMSDGTVLAASGHPGRGSEVHESTGVERFDPSTGQWSGAFTIPSGKIPPALPTALSEISTPPLEATGADIHIFGMHFNPMVYFPRFHLLEGINDKIFSSTALRTNNKRMTCVIDSQNGTLTNLTDQPPHTHMVDWLGSEAAVDNNIYTRSAFGSVLLPFRPPNYQARILITGGAQTYTIEPNNAHLGWQEAGDRRSYPIRAYLNTILLPDGKVLCIGGTTSEKGNFWRGMAFPTIETGGLDKDQYPFPEIFDPATDSWQTLPPPPYTPIPRVYHSVALLLPDATVWIAGSDHDGQLNHAGLRADDPSKGDARELQMEIYSPPYLFAKNFDGTDVLDGSGNPVLASRPTITSVNRITFGYGQTLILDSPDTSSNSKVILIRNGSVTHAHNFDQRFVELNFQVEPGVRFVVDIPNRPAILPPGYYMLFIVTSSGVPSIARFIQISHTAPLVTLPYPEKSEEDRYDFGTLRLQEQRTTTFHFTNDGTGKLRVIEVTVDRDFRTEDIPFGPITGTPAQQHNLEFEIVQSSASPGNQIEVKVTFIAEEAGLHSGTIDIMTNAVNLLGGRIRIPIHAQVDALNLLPLRPAPNVVLDLGSVTIGNSKTEQVELRNIGTIDAILDSYSFSAAAAALEISVETGPIRQGQIRAYNLTYTPNQVGLLNTNLTLHFTHGIAPSQYSQDVVMQLTATGIGAQIEILPPMLDFGTITLGSESMPQSIFVRNIGQQPLAISGISISTDFRVINPLPPIIAPGQTEQLSVVFRPGHDGSLYDPFTVSSNSVQSPTPITLQGIGVIQPLLHTIPNLVDYGVVPFGSRSGEMIVVVRNDGAVPIQLGAISIVGSNASDFLIIGSTCAGVVLRQEGTCQVRIFFKPSSPGMKQATLKIVHNGPTSPLETPLTGQGIAASGLVPDAIDIDFNRVAAGISSGVLRLVITNADATAANIIGVVINGAAAADFRVVDDTCSGAVLVPGNSCSLGVAVQPTMIGPRLATLTVNANVPANTVSLHAEGFAVVAQWTPALLDFGAYVVGGLTSKQNVSLLNVGNAPLTVNRIELEGDFTYVEWDPTQMTIGPINGEKFFSVQFRPTVAGAQQGWLRVYSDALDSPYSLELMGIGTV